MEKTIRRIETLLDNNYFVDGKFIMPIHARFELKRLWNIAFGESLSTDQLIHAVPGLC